MTILGLNDAQVLYTILVIGLAGTLYGWKFYKQHQKKQLEKWKRREWKKRY